MVQGPPGREHQALVSWQAERLRRTYRDLLADSRHRRAIDFVLNNLYGPQDFTHRDRDIARAYPLMKRVLPPRTLLPITRAMELHALTMHLDERLVEALRGAPGEEIDAARYAQAYRSCDNYADRQLQIELVLEIGRELDEIVRKPLILRMVRMAHMPARLAGFGELQAFIERGLRTFRDLGGADALLRTIGDRETAILEAIRAGEAPSE